MESREVGADFRTDFSSGDTLSLQYSQFYELLSEPFAISPGVIIPPGGYDFGNLGASYTAGSQHRLSGTTSLDVGQFYDGDKTTASFRGRLEVTPQLGVEPNISLNWIDLPEGRFTTTLVSGRAIFTVTPRMFVAALVQYTRAIRRFRPISDSAGSIGRAANCLSCTARADRPCRSAGQSSRTGASS